MSDNPIAGIVKEAKELIGSEWTLRFVATLFCGLLSPGVLVIWYFRPNFITELSTAKLVLLALSVSSPVMGLNTFVLNWVWPKKSRLAVPVAIWSGSLILLLATVPVFFIGLIWNLSISVFAILTLAAEIILFVWLRLGLRHNAQPPT